MRYQPSASDKAQQAQSAANSDPKKPDAKVVQAAQESAEHIATQEEDADGEGQDAQHGFSQDSGYPQSGGAKRESS